MYVKYVNGQIEQWPYDMVAIKADNPTVAFPNPMDADTLAAVKKQFPDETILDTPDLSAYNAFPVTVSEAASHNGMVQRPVLSTPVLTDGVWTAEYVIENRPQEQAENIVRENRDGLLKDTDVWALSDRTMTQAQKDYRQSLRDVPKQSGFPFSVVWPTKP